MKFIEIDHNPSWGQLKLFGILWLVFFGATGGITLHRGDSVTAVTFLWATALLIPAAGWLSPRFMRLVYVGMAYAAFPVGFVVSFVILLAVYYVILTPIGLLMRLVGYDPMNKQLDKSTTTYWYPRERVSLDSYFRQF